MSEESEKAELFDDPTPERAVAFAKKYTPHMAHYEPLQLVAGVHKARLRMAVGIEKQRESQEWLKAHGFKAGVHE